MERDSIKEQGTSKSKRKEEEEEEETGYTRDTIKEKKAFDERSEDRILGPAVFFGCEEVLQEQN